MRPYEDKFLIQTINKYNKLLNEEESGLYRIVKTKEEKLAGYLYEEEKHVDLEIARLFHGDNLIMELTPKEIQGYFEFIKNAKGRVGIVGLGLGYLVQELAKKKEVTEVVVYEISSEVIEIYKKNFKKFPKIGEAAVNRHIMYNTQLEFVKQCEENGTALVIQPAAPLHVSTLEKDVSKLESIYQLGYKQGLDRADEIKAFLND